MIVVSCRRHFDSNRRLAPALQFREYPDPARPGDWRAVTPGDLAGRAAGRRVCLLVHGYNNALPAILDAYAELRRGMAAAGLTGRAPGVRSVSEAFQDGLRFRIRPQDFERLVPRTGGGGEIPEVFRIVQQRAHGPCAGVF